MTTNLCSVSEETVHLYLDGELNPADTESFVTHLQHCQSCKTRLTALQSLFAELDSLENVAVPAEIAPLVMANLPTANAATESTTVGWLALIGQVIIGSVLLFFAWPTTASISTNRFFWQSWQLITDMSLSLNRWLIDISTGALNWPLAQTTQFQQSIDSSGLNIPPELTIGLVFGLGLAWLIGNGVLLGRNISPLNNGGSQ